MNRVARVLLRNACKTLAPFRNSPDHCSGESSRTLYKHFTSVSPDQSGHCPPSLRAPMLGGQPLTDMVSSKQTRWARLWIRKWFVLPRVTDSGPVRQGGA